MIVAYSIPESNDYRLSSDNSREIYRRKDEIKAAGGRWDGRHWIVTDEQRRSLGIERMVRCVVDDGHEMRETKHFPESQAIVGERVRGFCGLCDSHANLLIVEVTP